MLMLRIVYLGNACILDQVCPLFGYLIQVGLISNKDNKFYYK